MLANLSYTVFLQVYRDRENEKCPAKVFGGPKRVNFFLHDIFFLKIVLFKFELYKIFFLKKHINLTLKSFDLLPKHFLYTRLL